jgi:hypothetical protein
MAMIELVDFNELYNGGKEVKKAKAVVVEKLKADKEADAQLLLKLKLQLTLLNNYEDNHSIILKDKLFIVYPFFYSKF